MNKWGKEKRNGGRENFEKKWKILLNKIYIEHFLFSLTNPAKNNFEPGLFSIYNIIKQKKVKLRGRNFPLLFYRQNPFIVNSLMNEEFSI